VHEHEQLNEQARYHRQRGTKELESDYDGSQETGGKRRSRGLCEMGEERERDGQYCTYYAKARSADGDVTICFGRARGRSR
jgi:hypothetical protein